ncbi:MAG: hypothetical protein OXE93_07850 [bacterium]|nr:hypothetical protein [bacterium]
MPRAPIHIINHTHWDREWFLTQEYTTEWIPQLVDAVSHIASTNPHYRYLLDGQTLICEDLIRTRPDYAYLLKELVGKGTLSIGPLYSQPDWRIASGELLLRNLQAGLADVAHYGGHTTTAWLVDTFGHISQAPQMLALSGVDTAFVWRGVPQLEPLFMWVAPNGSQITAVNLFGGYRNLYGISKTPDLAIRRLKGEQRKLAPFYGHLPIPLFDGYDLETEPEDPVAILNQLSSKIDAAEGNAAPHTTTLDGITRTPDGIELLESSPHQYVQALAEHLDLAPAIHGELLSGKYGATFPGSLSTRTYLKLLHADTEHLLHRICEPLATLVGTGDMSRYEEWNRELLRNAVHDCICGVSIDAVHERMERSYRNLLNKMHADVENSLRHLTTGLCDGQYVLSTSAIALSGSKRVGESVYEFNADGFGLFATKSHTVQKVSSTINTKDPVSITKGPVSTAALNSTFGNSTFGPVSVHKEHSICLGDVMVGPLEVYRDAGDTYSSEPSELLAVAHITQAEVETVSAVDAVLLVSLQARWTDGKINADLRFRFSQTSTVELDLSLDSHGTNFIAELHFKPPTTTQPTTNDPSDTSALADTPHSVVAGMPFDAVERPHTDTNLFSHQIAPDLARVLMGQREVNQVDTFPFHDFVSTFDGKRSFVVHARGIRAYRATPEGNIVLPLRRSVEWLATTGLKRRAGDAGPAMYVPGARCERNVLHQLGISLIASSPHSQEFITVCEAFRNPPILVEVVASEGTHHQWIGFAANLPISALLPGQNGPLARFYNPTNQAITTLGHSVGPYEIVQLLVRPTTPPVGPVTPKVYTHGLPTNRSGRSRSTPNQQIVQHLAKQARKLKEQAHEVRSSLPALSGDAYHLAVHKALIDERECQELELAIALNQLRLDNPDAEVSLPDHPLPNIAEIGQILNDLRIRRRIYDYVVDLLQSEKFAR